MKKVGILFIMIFTIGFFTVTAQAMDVSIGTGGTQGVYYPTGIDICEMINAVPEYDIHCEPVSSGGSIMNIMNVLNGFWQFGIAQSDRQYDAWNGLRQWDGNPQENLRAVFSIHYESVTLIAAVDAEIETIYDLVGKKVNIGTENSGGYKLAVDILGFAGIDYENDLDAYTYKSSIAATEFQNGNIDAFFITIGHPSNFIETVVKGDREVYFVPLELEGFIDTFPYYTVSTIPMKKYKKAKNHKDVPTVGVKATFITSVDLDDEIVYAFTREILGQFKEFRELHPTREELSKNDMLKELSAPIHPGAMKYYKEVIFIKSECVK